MKRTERTALAMAGAIALAGCTGVVTPSSSSSTSSSAPGTASTSASATPTRSTAEFGADATVPDDGVRELSATGDEWTLVNRTDNAYARVRTPVGADDLAVEAQAQVAAWLGQHRTALGSGDDPSASVSAGSQDTAGTGSPGPGSTSTGSTSTGSTSTAASGTGSAAAGSAGSSASSASQPGAASGAGSGAASGAGSDSGSASGGSPSTPAEAEADSFRALSQLLADGRGVTGLRLYSRSSTGQGVVEHRRTLWLDRASGRIVDGTALFAEPEAGAADPVGTARGLIGSRASGLSDRDLFSAAAFTPAGDLLLYLPAVGDASGPVTLTTADVSTLLSPMGQEAQAAATSR